MALPIVFFDIAGADTTKLTNFYASLFGWGRNEHGNLSVPVIAPLRGTIRAGSNETRIYIGVPDVTASLALFKDTAGNPMGVVEMIGDAPRIP